MASHYRLESTRGLTTTSVGIWSSLEGAQAAAVRLAKPTSVKWWRRGRGMYPRRYDLVGVWNGATYSIHRETVKD